jgi:hypothetical protein
MKLDVAATTVPLYEESAKTRSSAARVTTPMTGWLECPASADRAPISATPAEVSTSPLLPVTLVTVTAGEFRCTAATSTSPGATP